jgi:hypothetical protein
VVTNSLCDNVYQATTPINIPRLASELKDHPDQVFVHTLISGLQEGFYTGISEFPQISLECKNLRSAGKHKKFVSSQLALEVERGYLIGPYDKPPFDVYRANPVGVAQGKYSGKKRLIFDLSAPHNSLEHSSLNSLIDKDEYSLSYVRLDDAIQAIKRAGVGAHLMKLDIQDAFHIVPLNPEIWRFYGLRWLDKYYFHARLAFGSRSSPKLFDMVSQAICYIAHHNYGIEVIMHLLDDFFSVQRSHPDIVAERTMALLTHIFGTLGVPLSKRKTVGPVHVLEYLGVILDSDLMQARLPRDKVERVMALLDEVSRCKTCTKKKLLSLLGHLNFASRVILPGRAFVSYLLRLAHSVKELHHRVSLTRECRLDMQMWRQFLSTWNGVSFFHDDIFTESSDMGLFTDASGSIGYGGYWEGQWFQGRWPSTVRLEPGSGNDISIAYMELYPIVVAALLWGKQWRAKKITFICDNQATVAIIKKGRSRSPMIMKLMRKLTLCAAQNNFTFNSKFLSGRLNVIADALSRFQNTTFRRLAANANQFPCRVPLEMMSD